MKTVTLSPPLANASFSPGAARSLPKAWLPILGAMAAFVIDVRTPNGVVDGLLYVSAVLACVWVPRANSALYTALALMPLMLLGLALSPTGISMELAVTNRCVAVGIVWVAAFAVWRAVRSARARESTLSALSEQLRAAERAACEERTALCDWIRTEITPELQVLEWRLRCLPHRTGRDFDIRSEALILRRAIRRTTACAREREMRLRHEGSYSGSATAQRIAAGLGPEVLSDFAMQECGR
jgi:hypothetical protein